MRFTKFIIQNFKGIKNLEIKLNPKSKVYTLVGLNESGKTSILEALRAFRYPVSEKERHKLIPKSEKLNFNNIIGIAADLELSQNDISELSAFIKEKGFLHSFIGKEVTVSRKYSFKDSNPLKSEYSWNFAIDVRKKGETKKARLFKADNALWNEVVRLIESKYFPDVIYYENFLFDFPEKIYLNKDSENDYSEVVQDILYSIDKKLSIEDHLLNRLKNPSPSNDEALDLTLASMGTKISEVVFKAWEKLFHSGKKEIVVRYGRESIPGNPINYFYLQLKLKEGSNQFFIHERSLGFRWFFSFLLFTEFRKHRITDKGEMIFLLDEPASNLHLTAQKNLLNTFNELIDKSYLIYTTHSHHLINPDWLNGIFIVKNKALNYSDELNYDTSKTDIEIIPYRQFAAKYPDQREYFQPILDTLDYQPGLLEKIPSIIITEGKFDYFIFKYVNKIYFNDKFKLNFYPGGGASSSHDVIRLYISWARKFIVLRDSDDAGKKSIANYKSIFQFDLDGRAFTFQNILPELDNHSVESIFSLEEQIEICKSFDPAITQFNKSAFNTSILIALGGKSKFTLSEETLDRFSKIFTFLEEKLITQS